MIFSQEAMIYLFNEKHFHTSVTKFLEKSLHFSNIFTKFAYMLCII